ncbi:hypothetical protein [Nonomuraea sp. SBT364]|uniref:hypothetical protein n=1 Tax=Nonomuraea sp. SBT364 TaxID=1580530 RepID=UPI00066C9717|nr:hypothetical protein [Nonomuraea sp. SBT364]
MTGTTPSSYQANVWLSYHQLQIRDANELGPDFPDRFDNGLITVADKPDGATILTGISIGPVEVTVQLTEELPPPNLDSWEEIVEVSIESTSGSLIVCGLDGDLPNLPNLAWHGKGFYRLRVHVRGRDTRPDGSVSAPVEHYLISSSPAEPQPAMSIKHADMFGTGIRRRHG